MSLMNYRSLKSTWLEILLVIFMLGGCASQQPSYQQPQKVRPVQPVAVPEPIPEAVTSQPASISNIEVTEREDTIRVVINGTEPLTYSVIQMEFPLRLVIDVAGARLDAPAERIAVDTGVITEINSSELEVEGETTTRIEVGLNSYMAHYEFLPSGNDLFIDFLRPQLMKEAEHIVDVAINEGEEYIQVDVVADGTIDEFNSFGLEDPSRLVLDFPGLKVCGMENTQSTLG